MIGKLTGEGEEEGAGVQKKPLTFSTLNSGFEHRHENKSCSACPKDQHSAFVI